MLKILAKLVIDVDLQLRVCNFAEAEKWKIAFGVNFFLPKMLKGRKIIPRKPRQGANPTIASYNATGSLVRFKNNKFIVYYEKRSSLLQRWRGVAVNSKVVGFVQVTENRLLGPIFHTFFSADFFGKTIFQNFFRGKFHFFKTFSAENSIFPNIFGGKFSAEFSPKFFPENNVRKIDPSCKKEIF
jgi:hypothetical protein